MSHYFYKDLIKENRGILLLYQNHCRNIDLQKEHFYKSRPLEYEIKSKPGEKVALKQGFAVKKVIEHEAVEGSDEPAHVAHLLYKNRSTLSYKA